MESKTFITADGLLSDSFGLAKKIFDSGYKPEVLVCLWRGGTPVGIAVHEYLVYKGIETNHVAIKASSYSGPGAREDVEVEKMDAFVDSLPSDSRVLIIDDIYDTGSTMSAMRAKLKNKVTNLKTATIYYKTPPKVSAKRPDFYVRKTKSWIVFPHELVGLSADELKAKDSVVYDLVMGEGK